MKYPIKSFPVGFASKFMRELSVICVDESFFVTVPVAKLDAEEFLRVHAIARNAARWLEIIAENYCLLDPRSYTSLLTEGHSIAASNVLRSIEVLIRCIARVLRSRLRFTTTMIPMLHDHQEPSTKNPT